MFIPIFTGQNSIDPVGAAARVAREFSAKKPELDSRCLGSFAAGDIRVAQNRLFTVLQVINAEMRFPVAAATIVILVAGLVGYRSAQIKDPVVDHPDRSIIPWHNFEPDDAITNSVGVYFNHHRFLWL